jgi:hypothetical protein
LSVRSRAITVACLIALSLAGIIAIQHRLLADTRDELTTTKRELVTLKTAVIELERDAAVTAKRETTTRIVRERLISAPVTDDAEISNVLREGLLGADLIGGHQ